MDDTCKHFGYMIGQYRKSPVQIAPYYNVDGKLVAQKLRFPNKDFSILGDIKEALPFGAHCWPKAGRMLVVTEGEIDAMSMSQVQGNKWPVVSIGCGAGPQIKKYFARQREYFNGFESVILMFDMDEPGRQAAKDAAAVLGARAKIADLPLKDANEMLCASRADELIKAMWNAKEYRPEGIVDMADLKEAVMLRPMHGLSWPFESLTKHTFGIRTGEIYALGAGTGVGKTDFFAECIKHLAVEHKVPVGVFSLEQSPSETATRIAGKLAKKTFHIPDSGWTDTDFEVAWATLMDSGKVFLYDSFGNNDWEVVKEKMEYLYHAHGVRHFFLDHLTALAAWQDDERRALEVIMSEMGSLVKRYDCTIFFVSHLATPEGKPHEEGGRVMIRHFKGSRAIGFWSHFMFALERNQQANSESERQVSTFRVLKDRYTGRSTGEVFYLGYDQETGLLYETTPADSAATHGFEDETLPAHGEGGF
jgi:twinkle protein